MGYSPAPYPQFGKGAAGMNGKGYPAQPDPTPAYFLPENLLSFEPDYGQYQQGFGYHQRGGKGMMRGKGDPRMESVWPPQQQPPPERVKSYKASEVDTPSVSTVPTSDSDERLKTHGSVRLEPTLPNHASVVIDGRLPDADEYAAGPEYQYRQGDSPHGADGAKWHVNAGQVGRLSDCGHYFVKDTVAPLKSTSAGYLPPLCMLFERSLRFRGVHEYTYSIYEGEVGPAGGVGFVFDTRIRRRNIQKMRSIFLNARGQVCLRNEEKITKLPTRLPFIAAGSVVRLRVDLTAAHATFQSFTPGKGGDEQWSETIDVDFTDTFEDDFGETMQTGFFCAIVTNRVSVSLF
jgi:hypothetical protein